MSGLLDKFFFKNRLDAFNNNYETFSTQAINTTENFPNFVVELAELALKKEDFAIEIEEDTLGISCPMMEETKTLKKMVEIS